MVHELLDQVRNTVRQNHLFSPGDTVFAAVSGGADSVALLHILMACKDEWELSEIRVLHVNHQLRATAARDELFVRDLCVRYHLPLNVHTVDVAFEAESHHETLEEAGRRIRYAFFKEQASKVPSAKIAVAHNEDDHAETVLFHIIRGCGVTGLCGIPVTRGQIVRPLLACSADAIRKFCRTNGYTYQEDETNTDMYYARNRIRHEILPSMQQINPQASKALVRLSSIAQEEDEFIDYHATALLNAASVSPCTWDRPALLSAEAVIVKRSLAKAVKAVCGEAPHYLQIAQLYDALKNTGTTNLPRRYSAVVDDAYLHILPPVEAMVELPQSEVIRLDVPFIFGTQTICAHRLTMKEFAEKSKIHKNLFNFCISYDMIQEDLFVRSRKSGDELQPALRGCTKTLKKLYQEWNIPRWSRHQVPVLCNKNNEILAVLGYTVSERAAISKNTTETIIWFEILSEGCDEYVNA